MITYAARVDLERAFGATNIAKWADVNNTGVAADIAARIDWALEMSFAEVNDRLRNGPYAIPFQMPYPATIVRIQTYLAAVLLYDSRGVTDTDDEEGRHSLTRHEKMARRLIAEIFARRIRLDTPLAGTDYPKVITDE